MASQRHRRLQSVRSNTKKMLLHMGINKCRNKETSSAPLPGMGRMAHGAQSAWRLTGHCSVSSRSITGAETFQKQRLIFEASPRVVPHHFQSTLGASPASSNPRGFRHLRQESARQSPVTQSHKPTCLGRQQSSQQPLCAPRGAGHPSPALLLAPLVLSCSGDSPALLPNRESSLCAAAWLQEHMGRKNQRAGNWVYSVT